MWALESTVAAGSSRLGDWIVQSSSDEELVDGCVAYGCRVVVAKVAYLSARGLVRKESLEDFLNVLKWSMDFGVDSQHGRMIKQGVIGIFAGTAFNPKDKVKVGSEILSVAQYAARMNIQPLKASDLNEILQAPLHLLLRWNILANLLVHWSS